MNKTTRFLTALAVSLVLGCQFAYRDSQANGPEFQAHPVIVVITDLFCGYLSGLIFYFGSGWFAKRKNKKRDEVENNKFYDQIALELQQKTLIAGLWTKAYAEMDGDEAKARALYIRYRVQQLRENSADQAKQELSVRNINLWKSGAAVFGFITLLALGLVVYSIVGMVEYGDDIFDKIPYIVGLAIGCIGAYIFGWFTHKCLKN